MPTPGVPAIGDTHVLGPFVRNVEGLKELQRKLRIFGPDETVSNGLAAVFETTNRPWLAPTGRVMEMLSEHPCEGSLEGYLPTGRLGLFNCHEAFIHIVDSIFNQVAKWLVVDTALPWRRRVASLSDLPEIRDCRWMSAQRKKAL